MVGEMKRRYGATILNYGARDEETILWWARWRDGMVAPCYGARDGETILWWARWGKTRFARFPQAFYTLNLHHHARIVVPHWGLKESHNLSKWRSFSVHWQYMAQCVRSASQSAFHVSRLLCNHKMSSLASSCPLLHTHSCSMHK